MSENTQHDSPEASAGPNAAPEAPPAEAAATSPAELIEAQLKDKDAKYAYLYAEFENYKKRMMKERSDLIKFGWEGVARELLQIADNLDRAIAHAPADADQNFLSGLKMVFTHFQDTLKKQGVQLIETAERPFDPHLHEAMAEEESDQPPGTIVREHSKGYTLHGRLLRPSRVSIAKSAAS